MNLTSKTTISDLLKRYNAAALKGLGQHFLIDKGVLIKIIEAANLGPEDTILEIGPGIGVLTQELAKKTEKVISIEKDPKMVEILKETLLKFKNIEVIEGDILKLLNPELKNQKLKLQLKNQKYKVVANIPYYLTSHLIRGFLEIDRPPLEMILMIQKEVAKRICAKPPGMNLLAVSVQFYSKPEIISYVSKSSFWPKPKVDSVIIKIAPLINPDRKLINVNLFFKIVKAGFSQPRKQLINNLSKGLNLPKEKTEKWLRKNKILPQQRAETLSIEDWKNLVKGFIPT